jgi:hypothetical protein
MFLVFQPGVTWRDTLISCGHTSWLLKFYGALREKYSYDTLWNDSLLAYSIRQLIVQLCSLAGAVFPPGTFILLLLYMK